jgi:predicted transcriptional regulator
MDILKVSAEGSVKPTHIMYRSNTSWIVMQKNLEALVASGFIRQRNESSRVEYSITDSGRSVLRDYVSLLEKAAASPAEVRM